MPEPTIRGDSAYSPRSVLEFNLLPSRYIHESWIEAIPNGTLLQRLRSCQRTQYNLSSYILECLGIENSFCYDFSGSLRPIALASSDELSRLILYTGIALNSTYIRGVIERTTLLNIIDNLGEEAYRFSLDRAPQLMPESMVINLPYPPKGVDIRIHVLVCGLQCFSCAFIDQPRAFIKRLMLKLEYRWACQIANRKLDFSPSDSAELISRLAVELSIDR